MMYDIHWEPQINYVHFRGVVSDAEFLRSVDDIQGDPRFDALRFAINDFSNTTNLQLTRNVIEFFAAKVIGSSHSNPNICIVFITTDESLATTINEILPITEDFFRTKIFVCLKDAWNWIKADQQSNPYNSLHVGKK